jgi:hypothetical protein
MKAEWKADKMDDSKAVLKAPGLADERAANWAVKMAALMAGPKADYLAALKVDGMVEKMVELMAE